jgi:hypothetical protein
MISGGGAWPQQAKGLLEATTRLGATRTLSKPFRPGELVQIVDEMLRAVGS